MSYIAIHYVRDNDGVMYSPGEIIPAKKLDAGRAREMLLQGAIRKADAPFQHPVDEDEADAPVPAPQSGEKSLKDDQEDDLADSCADDDLEEEVPVIDAMDGLVAPSPENEKPAVRSKRGKK